MKPEAEIKRPEVIVDIEFKDGLFFVVIKNIGNRSALRIMPRIDKKVVGLEGRKQVNRMNIFKGIEFIPPGKEIRFLLDSAPSYFARKQPTRFSIVVSYLDSSGKRYQEEIRHNLEIYRDMPFVLKTMPTITPQGSE